MIKTYQVYIDVPGDCEWEDIDVKSMEIEAFNCKDAHRKAIREAQKRYSAFYVWEVIENDKL